MISGSSAFSKSSLNFWEFLVHVLLKTSLENFELYFALACKMSAIVQYFEHFLALPFFGIGMKTLFPVLWPLLFSLVAQSCLTLCNPMDCNMPGLPVHYQLLELAQTHVHLVNDAIQPSYPLLSPSPPVFNLSQHQGLFQ